MICKDNSKTIPKIDYRQFFFYFFTFVMLH